MRLSDREEEYDSPTWIIEMMALFFVFASFLIIAAFFVGKDLDK
jgi:hypothetical protein